jgi:heat shock protein HslJ
MNLTHLTRAAFALGIALAAVSCGDDSTQAENTDPTVSEPPGDSAQAEDPLVGTAWLIDAVAEGSQTKDPPAGSLRLQFLEPARVLVDLGCNTASGEYSADDNGNFDAEALAQTAMACADTEDWKLLADAMAQATSWSIEDGNLELAGPALTVRAAE